MNETWMTDDQHLTDCALRLLVDVCRVQVEAERGSGRARELGYAAAAAPPTSTTLTP